MTIATRTRCHVIPALMIVILFTVKAPAEDLRVLAAELGLTPESLIVADIHTQAAIYLARLDFAESERQQLSLQRQAASNNRDQISALQAQLEADPENATLQADLAIARSQLATLRAQIAVTLEELKDIVFDGVAQEDLDVISSWVVAARNQAPDEFGAIALSDDQWRAVRQALRAETRALRRGRTLDSRHTEVLGDVRANFDVIAAKQRLNANRAIVTLVFDQYAE